MKTAQAALISVDNFGYATDYGNDGCPIRNGGSIIILFDLFASEFEDETLSWTAEHMRAALPNSSSTHFPHPGWGGCASHRDLKQKRTNCGDLELLELDGHILKKHAPEMIGMNILDKIGYRGGWEKESQFLFFEPYAAGSHTHLDMNAVLRGIIIRAESGSWTTVTANQAVARMSLKLSAAGNAARRITTW